MTSQMESNAETSAYVVQDEPQDELELLKRELKPFAQALSEDIEKKPICKATAYEIAIAMIADIVIKILDYQEKKIIFPKKVISGLWSIQSGESNINLIGMIYQYMTICGSYPDAKFKKSTYGSTISKKLSSDINYRLDPKQAYIPLKDCKFVLLLKVFRSILAYSIKHTTGKYEVPNEKDSNTWRYLYVDNQRQQHFLTSKEFIEFTLEMGQVYGEIDKLSPQLSEIHEIFNEAATASKLEKQERLQNIEASTLQQKKSKYYDSHKRQNYVKQNDNTLKTTVEWEKVDKQVPLPSVWGKINPITKKSLPVMDSVPQSLTQSTSTEECCVDDTTVDDGFELVVKRRGKG